jgi:hypothetical protein
MRGCHLLKRKLARKIVAAGLGTLILGLAAVPYPAQAAERDYLTALVELRAEYARAVKRADDPEVLMALSVGTAGRVWANTAHWLARRHHRPNLEAALNEVEADYLKITNNRRSSPESRQVAGMRLMYQAVYTMSNVLTFIRKDKRTFNEIQAIHHHVTASYDPKKKRSRNLMVLSNGAMMQLALGLRSTGRYRGMARDVNREIEAVIAEAKAINQREDVHQRGRMFLLALNNLRACFKLVYMFNLAVDQRLSKEVDPVRQAWEEKAGPNQSATQSMVVTMAALTEVSFPVCVLLVSR